MDWLSFHNILVLIQRAISSIGILVIISGILMATYRYIIFALSPTRAVHDSRINLIRLDLGRVLILGLEFIVAADLISTISAPDYYSIGIVAIVVTIRTVLTFSINKELMSIRKEAK